MPRNVFRAEFNDYMVYHELLTVTDGFRLAVKVSTLTLGRKLVLSTAEVERAIGRLEEQGYIEGQWLTELEYAA